MAELESLVLSMDSAPLFIAVTETWCQDSDIDSFYLLPNYQLLRRDRSHRLGGGVLLYIHTPSTSQNCRLTDLETENEDLWVKLTPRSAAGRELIICTTCRPPSTKFFLFLFFFFFLESFITKRICQALMNKNL